MKTFKRYALSPALISIFVGLILSLTQSAMTINAQTPNRDEIRGKIKQLEQQEKDLSQSLAVAKEWAAIINSDKYIIIPYEGIAYPVLRKDAERRWAIA